MAVLNIYFDSLAFENVVQVPAYTWLDILSKFYIFFNFQSFYYMLLTTTTTVVAAEQLFLSQNANDNNEQTFYFAEKVFVDDKIDVIDGVSSS